VHASALKADTAIAWEVADARARELLEASDRLQEASDSFREAESALVCLQAQLELEMDSLRAENDSLRSEIGVVKAAEADSKQETLATAAEHQGQLDAARAAEIEARTAEAVALRESEDAAFLIGELCVELRAGEYIATAPREHTLTQ
jgi:hypothetical protein